MTITHGNIIMLVSLTSTDGTNTVTSSFPVNQSRGFKTDVETLQAMNAQKLAELSPAEQPPADPPLVPDPTTEVTS